MSHSFVFTGGGTGGHVFPALAVAEVLRQQGHRILYIGTRDGMEARIVPEQGYDMAYVPSGKLNRVGLLEKLRTAAIIPASIFAARSLLRRAKADAVFSMGGYVAGPVMAAAILNGTPLIIMEPNALPGAANRLVAKRVYRALLGFEATKSWFPPNRAELTGVPVRPGFFNVPRKQGGKFTVLITGGSRGARTLNRAARESWPIIRQRNLPIRIILQTGAGENETLSEEFKASGLDGSVVPFIRDMPGAFAEADLVIGRSGAGGVNEVAAAGMPAIFVPFPFAADDHQLKNAETLAKAGAAHLVLDRDWNGARMVDEIEKLRANPSELESVRTRVRAFARPDAAERAAAVLIEAAQRKKST